MAQAVYWLGQDGNIYYGSGKEGASVQNMGKPVGQGVNAVAIPYRPGMGFDAERGSAVAKYIDDPNPGGNVLSESTTAPNGRQSGVQRPALNQAGIDNTLATIRELPSILANALANQTTQYNNTNNAFNQQEATQRGQYAQSSDTNQGNYDSNYMAALRAGRSGLSGLMSALRGTGAEGWADQVVGNQTASDIKTGLDTRNENQQQLDNTLNGFLSDLERKRIENRDTYENNKRAVQRDNDTRLQKLYGDIAGMYGDAGRTAEYNDYMGRAGRLTSDIARNSMTQLSNYDTTPITVKAPEITAFSKPVEQGISAQPGGNIGAGLFTIGERRKDREAVGV